MIMIICIDISLSITEENWAGTLIRHKNSIDSQNELIIFEISQNLTNTFKPWLKTLLQRRFKIIHCYRVSNNSLI